MCMNNPSGLPAYQDFPSRRDYVAHRKAVKSYVDTYRGDWVEAVARDCAHEAQMTYADFERLTDLAWEAREHGLSALTRYSLDAPSKWENAKSRWAVAVVLLQSARFDFNYQSIKVILGELEREEFASFGLYDAFDSFATMAAPGEAVEESKVRDQIRAAYSLRHEKIAQLLLHGMWLAPEGGYADAMIETCDNLLTINNSDPVTYLRKAEGHRRAGEYDTAVAALDKGIELNDPSATGVHGDFVRQRVLTIQERHQHERMRAMEEQLQELVTQYSEQLREEQYAIVFRIIEIVALLFAVIGVFGTSVSLAALGDIDWWGRAAIVAASSVVILGFVLVVRFVLRPPSMRRSALRNQSR